MTTLVIGATGNIGRHVVTGLSERGETVRTLPRPAGDLTKPETLHSALSGVDSAFLLWPFLTAAGAQEAVDVIAEHARRVVYVSALSAANDDSGVWGQVETAIRRSGLEWTFLRPGGFATNTLEWAPAIRAGEPARMPYPEAARSLIHERDIADVAVLALTEEGHAGKAYPLTGPAALTQAEQARILGATAIEAIPADVARTSMLTWGNEEFVDGALAYWRSLVDTPEPVTTTVEDLTGRPARTFTQWAQDHADDFRPLSVAEVG